MFEKPTTLFTNKLEFADPHPLISTRLTVPSESTIPRDTNQLDTGRRNNPVVAFLEKPKKNLGNPREHHLIIIITLYFC